MSLAQLIEEGLVQQDIALGPLTTYKAGGASRFYANPTDTDSLELVAQAAAGSGLPILVMGRGSNLLVAESGFEGLTIHISRGFDEIGYDGVTVVAGAGAPLPRVARGSVDAGIAGLEFFVGVPGSVGGAVRQNAGCFGVETKDRMIEATILDIGGGRRFTADPAQLEMSYRHSAVRADWVVVEASFSGTGTDVSSSKDEVRRITRWRKENQPGGTFNAGSVFKNPDDVTAGSLIDSAGLKGHSVGEVSVSEKHANFFVAGSNATSQQVRELIREVRELVEERTGITMEPEIQMVGFDDDD